MFLSQVSREQPPPQCSKTPPPSRGRRHWTKTARGQRVKAWERVRRRLLTRRLATEAVEGRVGIALRGRAATVRSLGKMPEDQEQAWRCLDSVVQGPQVKSAVEAEML